MSKPHTQSTRNEQSQFPNVNTKYAIYSNAITTDWRRSENLVDKASHMTRAAATNFHHVPLAPKEIIRKPWSGLITLFHVLSPNLKPLNTLTLVLLSSTYRRYQKDWSIVVFVAIVSRDRSNATLSGEDHLRCEF